MLGQRVSMTATVPSQGLSNHLTTYEYDPLYQLVKTTYPNVAPFNGEVDSWTYDAIGNRLSNTVNASTQTYTYQRIGANPLNWQRLLNDGQNAYTYDTNGSAITRNGPGGNFTFGQNADNRMASIAGAVTASYVYDYRGRRSGKTVGASTTYFYDGLNLIQEGGASVADYLFGPGIDEPLAMSRGGQIYYYETDALGSVNLLANSSGVIQNTYLYDAWGQVRSQTGSLLNSFGYTSRELGEAGLHFYRARYYSPGIGRFLSEDPIGVRNRQLLGPSANAYAYASNQPPSFHDPLGLAALDRGRNIIGNYCGPGGKGPILGPVDKCCAEHDACYDRAHTNAGQKILCDSTGGLLFPSSDLARHKCDLEMCDCLRKVHPRNPGEAYQWMVVWTVFRCQ